MTEFHKTMNRSMFLMSCEVWDKAERVLLFEMCDERLFFAPLFYYEKDKAISIYYNFTDPRQDPRIVADYFAKYISRLEVLKEKFDQDSREVRKLTDSKNPQDLEKLFNSVLKVWPLIALTSGLADLEDIDSVLLEKCIQIRKESDGLLHFADEQLFYKAHALVPEKYKNDIESLKLREVLDNDYPSDKELSQRNHSYVYHKGKIYSGINLNSFAKENDIEIVEEKADRSVTEIKGNVAHKGKATGLVKLVYERKDIEKVNEGDILVTAMTTPNLIEAMNKAVAFVTDEGGVTCHAAIIARELKKPCIIGTKTATQVLKDGMEVEVDANEGIVKIL